MIVFDFLSYLDFYEDKFVKNTSQNIFNVEAKSHIVPASPMSCLSTIWARRRVMKWVGVKRLSGM